MPKNLLLADDSITVQKMVGIVFAGEDFKITAVDNGEDAVARARELKPDVILADVVMPRKNGYEVCEAIKADPELRRIPVLLLAGTFEAFDDARARTARADGHIAKPFESQALIDKVRQLVSDAAASVQAPAPAAAAAVPVKPSQTVVSVPVHAPPAAAPRAAVPSAPARPSAPLPASAPEPRAAPPPASAIPPAAGSPGGMPLPPGFRPPPAALQAMPRPPRFPPPPVAGQTFASTLRTPVAPRAPVARPPAPAPLPPVAAKPAPAPIPAAPSGRSAWRDPFGLDAPEPRSPAPLAPVAEVAKAPPVPAVVSAPPPARVASPPPPDPSLELDWSDLDVTEEENPEFTALQPARGGPGGEPAAMVASIDELDFGEGPPAKVGALSPTALGAMDLPEVEPEEELAPIPQEIAAKRPAGARPAASFGAGDAEEAQLRELLSRASREVIERIAWEVVPQLAETIIREQIDRLAKERQR